MTRILPTVAALALVVASGVVHGLATHRWSTPPDLQGAADRLGGIPLAVGDWEGRALEANPRDLVAAGVSGGIMRRYVNRRDGRTVTVLLVCGRPGPVSVHTPDICYEAAGYQVVGAPAKSAVSGARPAEFLTAIFSKPGPAVADHLRIYWGWNGAGRWAAPEYPRLAFASRPVLYKLYAIAPATGPTEAAGGDPAAEFLRGFLPRVDEALFPAARPAA
jgi:hypothetical protein